MTKVTKAQVEAYKKATTSTADSENIVALFQDGNRKSWEVYGRYYKTRLVNCARGQKVRKEVEFFGWHKVTKKEVAEILNDNYGLTVDEFVAIENGEYEVIKEIALNFDNSVEEVAIEEELENLLDEIDNGKFAVKVAESRIEKVQAEFNEVKDTAEQAKAKEIQFWLNCAKAEIDNAEERIAYAMKDIDRKSISGAKAEIARMIERIKCAGTYLDHVTPILADVEEKYTGEVEEIDPAEYAASVEENAVEEEIENAQEVVIVDLSNATGSSNAENHICAVLQNKKLNSHEYMLLQIAHRMIADIAAGDRAADILVARGEISRELYEMTAYTAEDMQGGFQFENREEARLIDELMFAAGVDTADYRLEWGRGILRSFDFNRNAAAVVVIYALKLAGIKAKGKINYTAIGKIALNFDNSVEEIDASEYAVSVEAQEVAAEVEIESAAKATTILDITSQSGSSRCCVDGKSFIKTLVLKNNNVYESNIYGVSCYPIGFYNNEAQARAALDWLKKAINSGEKSFRFPTQSALIFEKYCQDSQNGNTVASELKAITEYTQQTLLDAIKEFYANCKTSRRNPCYPIDEDAPILIDCQKTYGFKSVYCHEWSPKRLIISKNSKGNYCIDFDFFEKILTFAEYGNVKQVRKAIAQLAESIKYDKRFIFPTIEELETQEVSGSAEIESAANANLFVVKVSLENGEIEEYEVPNLHWACNSMRGAREYYKENYELEIIGDTTGRIYYKVDSAGKVVIDEIDWAEYANAEMIHSIGEYFVDADAAAEVEELNAKATEKPLKEKIVEIVNRAHKSVIDWTATLKDYTKQDIRILQNDLKRFIELGEIELATKMFETIKEKYRALYAA